MRYDFTGGLRTFIALIVYVQWAWSHFFKGLDGWSLKPLIEGLGWSDRSVSDLTNLVRVEMCSYNSTHWRSV